MTGRKAMACWSAVSWHSIRMRPQQLMSHFANSGVDVAYVNPWMPFGDLRRRPSVLRDGRRAGIDVTGYGSLEVIQRVDPLPARIVAPRLRRQIRTCVLNNVRKRLKVRTGHVDHPVVWIDRPEFLETAVEMSNNGVLVYDCLDDYEAFSNIGEAQAEAIRMAEECVLDRADLVIASSQRLRQRLMERGAQDVLYVPNAADIDHFGTAPPDAGRWLGSITGPVIGYIGALADWLDWELVARMARETPQSSIVLIGPVQGSPHIPEMPRNVHLLGRLPYDSLPAVLSQVAVAVIPFLINDVTLATSPVKVFEYLAAGCPVVSTPLPELKALAGPYTLAEGDRFVASVQAQLGSRRIEDDAARKRWAASHSWAERAGRVEDALRIACGW